MTATQKKRVKRAVQTLRAKYGISGSMSQSDFRTICQGEDIEIMNEPEVRAFFKRFGSIVRGVAFHLENGIRAIALASLWEPRFDLFTAAHELGHTILGHRGYSNLISSGMVPDADAYIHSQPEQEADYFAQLMLEGGTREQN